MSFERGGRSSLDYEPIDYPGSCLRFRGPAVPLDAPHLLCLGGTETFGRFVDVPFTAQLADITGRPVANMGVLNAGLDLLTSDPAIVAAQACADAIVLQITGAQNISNDFYSVHPRRNDRFIEASADLRTLYGDVDFTEFHFVRHMLTHLRGKSKTRFASVLAELRQTWVARMTTFLTEAAVPVHLLWIGNSDPDRAPAGGQSLGADPLFVTRAMLETAGALASSTTMVVLDEGAGTPSTRGMTFGPMEEAAARLLPGPDLHAEAAHRLATFFPARGKRKGRPNQQRSGAA